MLTVALLPSQPIPTLCSVSGVPKEGQQLNGSAAAHAEITGKVPPGAERLLVQQRRVGCRAGQQRHPPCSAEPTAASSSLHGQPQFRAEVPSPCSTRRPSFQPPHQVPQERRGPRPVLQGLSFPQAAACEPQARSDAALPQHRELQHRTRGGAAPCSELLLRRAGRPKGWAPPHTDT